MPSAAASSPVTLMDPAARLARIAQDAGFGRRLEGSIAGDPRGGNAVHALVAGVVPTKQGHVVIAPAHTRRYRPGDEWIVRQQRRGDSDASTATCRFSDAAPAGDDGRLAGGGADMG